MRGTFTRRAAPHPPKVRPALLGVLLVLLVAVPGLGADPSVTPEPSAGGDLVVGADASPLADPSSGLGPNADPAASRTPAPTLTPAPDPLAPTITLTLDRADAATGDPVTATVHVTNPAPDPLLLRCTQPISVWADISRAVEGPRLDWATTDPWRRGMRDRLLADPSVGTGPLSIGFKAVDRGPACTQPTMEVAPGGSLDATFTWTVGYPGGFPLYGSDGHPVIVRARVEPVSSQAQVDAVEPAVPAAVAAEQPLAVASLRTGRILSPARAVEALFNDPEAAAWLDLEHGSTWRRADLRLIRGRWRFDVRRIATGCCRESMTAGVDATTGEVVVLDAPTLAWTAARTTTATFQNLELRLELQRILFRDGRSTRIRLTITNLDQYHPIWYWSHDNDCTIQPGIWIAAGPEMLGARWPGVLGAFKKEALQGELIIARAGPPQDHQCLAPEPLKLRRGHSMTVESAYRPAIVPTGQRTLQAVGRIDLVGPSSDSVRVWKVYASPTVRTRFRTGNGSSEMLSPSMLIDAALRHKDFAKRIKAAPRDQWQAAGVTGTSVWLELTDGTRIVGLP